MKVVVNNGLNELALLMLKEELCIFRVLIVMVALKALSSVWGVFIWLEYSGAGNKTYY